MANSSIGTLGSKGPGSNRNKEVLHIPQISEIEPLHQTV